MPLLSVCIGVIMVSSVLLPVSPIYKWSVIEQGVQLLGQSINHLHGRFELDSNIPIGVGMGASAALCMAVARWFVAQGKLQNEQTHTFARELEHLFHGQSSGLDIAGVAAEQGIYFKQGEGRAIKQAWQPRWFLSSCGQIGITSHCIQQVQTLWEQDPTKAHALDQQMSDCVSLAEKALEQDDPEANHRLVRAIESAAHCFQQWGLISESLQQHMQILRHAGAVAVKPTGSGGGGYVISLWNNSPPEFPFELISM